MALRSPKTLVLGFFGVALTIELVGALLLPMGQARIFKDEADIGVYLQRTAWVPAGSLPYRDVFQEYPPLGAYYLALPRLVAGDPQGYATTFYLLGASLLIGIFVLLWRHLPSRDSWHALVLCAPCVLFYSVNRYDALPALLFVGTVIAFVRGREGLSAVLFGIACGTKWYPIAAALVFVALARRPWRWMAWAAAATLVACAHPLLYASASAVFSPYDFHLARGRNTGSLYDVAIKTIPAVAWRDGSTLWRMLLALQFVPGVVAAAIAWRGRHEPSDWRTVARLVFAAVAGFTLFAKFHSPQWQVWLAPLCVLSVSPALTAGFVAADVLKYVAIPIVWYLGGAETNAMIALTSIYGVVLGCTILKALLLSASRRL